MADENMRIEVFRPGTFKPMGAAPINYSADDLAAIAASYDYDGAPAPVVIGHPKTDDPAFAWIEGIEYDPKAERLFANIGQVEPAFAEAVREGRYKKVSMAFHMPDAPNNPAPGKWYPKHLGFLGAVAPAVSGLKPVAFAQSDPSAEAVFEAAFGEAGFEEAAGLLRGLRDFLIEKFSLEEADAALPRYRLEWLADTEISPSKGAPQFANPPDPDPTTKESTMTNDELTAKRRALEARETALAERESAARAAANAAFAEKLIEGGKLLPAQKDAALALLNAAPIDTEVSFAEGAAQSLPDALKSFLENQPKVVEFGETPMGDAPEVTSDPAQIAAFAAEYQSQCEREGRRVSTADAVAHVSKEKGATS